MIRFSKIFLGITIVILLAWQLPWCYQFFASKASYKPFVLYSTLEQDFLSMTWDEEKGFYSTNLSGEKYDQEETDSLLPFFYIRQLISDSRVPDEINGIEVSPRSIQITNFNFRSVPSDINTKKANLYPLMESMSGRIELEMPDDVFRITKERIEFIDMESNTINSKKSKTFTKTMKSKGFEFPSKYIAGNPTTRKDYDEGYLLIDNKGDLFHLKMTKGRPYCRKIDNPDNINMKYLYITEFRDHKTLGYIIDANNKMYVLNNKTYKIIQTGVESYNPREDAMTIIGNMIDWTIRIQKDDADTYYAIDAKDYSLIKKHTSPNENDDIPGLSFTSFKDTFVKPRL